MNITHLFFNYELSGPNMRSINFDAKTKETCDCDCMINKGTYERFFEKDDEAIFDYAALWSFDQYFPTYKSFNDKYHLDEPYMTPISYMVQIKKDYKYQFFVNLKCRNVLRKHPFID